jgi:hypothetical protein
MVDDELIAAEAGRNNIVVSDGDVDVALGSVASAQKLTVAELLEVAREAGMEDKQYRAEIRRQVLEARMLQLRVVPRIKGLAGLSEAARIKRMEGERRAWLQELRDKSFVEVRL